MGCLAAGFQEVLPGVLHWRAYSPEHKVELAAHAVLVDSGWHVFDPIGLTEGPLAQLLSRAPVKALILTNANHERAAAQWQQRTAAPIWSHPAAHFDQVKTSCWPAVGCLWSGWRVFDLNAAAPGEVALLRPERSLLIVGDAVYDLPGHGRGVLPVRYCRDQALLRLQLRNLVEERFATLLMAHGSPWLSAAHEQLEQLLTGDRS